MFTIKLYKHDGANCRIFEAESFSVLRTPFNSAPSWAEITAHVKGGDGIRFDIGDSPYTPNGGLWERAIIENSAGRTTEIIGMNHPVKLEAA